MIVSIMQPAYLPWLGYFNRLQLSDLTIVLDHVQMDRSSKTRFANRNKIRTPQGWSWLTVPIHTKGLHGELFLDRIRVRNEEPWGEKMWRSIASNYRRTTHFETYAAPIRDALAREWSLLSALNWRLTEHLMKALGVELPVIFSSTLDVRSAKSDLIVDLCRHVGATTYISGPFGRDYLVRQAFVEAGVDLVFHDYDHPEYRQAFAGFEPYMSVIDVLFNHGPEAAAIIARGQALNPR